jgi:hypothetical protein
MNSHAAVRSGTADAAAVSLLLPDPPEPYSSSHAQPLLMRRLLTLANSPVMAPKIPPVTDITQGPGIRRPFFEHFAQARQLVAAETVACYHRCVNLPKGNDLEYQLV